MKTRFTRYTCDDCEREEDVEHTVLTGDGPTSPVGWRDIFTMSDTFHLCETCTSGAVAKTLEKAGHS